MARPRMNEEEDAYNKPGFDGRLRYFEVLKEIIASVSYYAMVKDYNNWNRSLRLMYSTTKPWLAKASKVKERLDAIREEVSHVMNAHRVSNGRLSDLDNELFDLQDQMIEGTKYLWLPGGANTEEEDIDIQKWMEESSI